MVSARRERASAALLPRARRPDRARVAALPGRGRRAARARAARPGGRRPAFGWLMPAGQDCPVEKHSALLSPARAPRLQSRGEPEALVDLRLSPHEAEPEESGADREQAARLREAIAREAPPSGAP